ncbi:flippase [Haloferax volcanii]|uniref:Probable low-salt glycan biosynthesis flippase Agl15 n=2 Tax=Haloferax volcanii TaxID=2246 RepID=AGL15_HALVD|nr:flippase [Haloferax volcanii]D4GU68.1 RecName: Full=Probable low-salt glycan biosynthesis flippase Agl15 [Haloferax volcanii DS2]ADE05104.1 putative low-salt glycan biosynthesis flippase Agl15 [Haloferax volcanii DS2]ELY33648.1 putative transport protein [Haloferax volcanii DS2]MBS8119323.1 flippase [Haloferax volcanii]MBS8124336.1 flippase [Haloferax volcanii]MBS8128205.1 flippase [Haloferax volcanii]
MDLARSSIKLFIANIFGAGLQFLGITFFARELGASQMGVFFLFQALLGIVAIPADFGLRGAVEKRISEGIQPGEYLSSAIILKLIPISLIILSIVVFEQRINGYLGGDFAVYLALAIILQETAQLAVSVLKGELRVGETAELNIIRRITWVGGGFLLVSSGLDAEALIYSLLAGMVVTLAWGLSKISTSLKKPSFKNARSLFNYSKYSVVSSIGGYFYSWMDVAIIGIFLTQSHVGAYETAWRVTAITMLFSQAVASTIFPQVSQWSSKNEQQQIESVISNSITPSMLLVIPAFFGILVFSDEIMGIVFGSEFTIASYVLIILAGEKILQSVHVIIGRSLQALNQPGLAARATVISVVLNLILNVILILSFGIVGAAVATALSFAVNTVLHAHYLSSFVSIKFQYSQIGWCTVSSLIMAGVLFGFKTLVGVNSLIQLFIGIFFGMLVYTTITLLYQPIRETAFKNLIRLVPI